MTVGLNLFSFVTRTTLMTVRGRFYTPCASVFEILVFVPVLVLCFYTSTLLSLFWCSGLWTESCVFSAFSSIWERFRAFSFHFHLLWTCEVFWTSCSFFVVRSEVPVFRNHVGGKVRRGENDDGF